MTTVPAAPFFWFRSWLLLLLAILCAGGMWTYINRVMIPHQLSDAAAQGLPRGNLSDLYPHWIGARELLLHGRDPYSPEITREIQQGYYGRPLDPARPGDPRDQQGFAYPVYVAFYLAPTIHLPFEIVRKGFFWVLFGLTVATIPLWLRVLRWSVPFWPQVSLIVFTIGSLTVVQGLKLQQMTLLVVALLAVAVALLASVRPIAAGVVLALATIKPQLVWLLLFWLLIWTLADWRRRYRFAASFLFTMAILCAASEWYLPHWIPRFLQAMHRYPSYTDAVSILDKLVPAPWGWMSTVLAVAAMVHIGWKNRRLAEDTAAFAATVSLAPGRDRHHHSELCPLQPGHAAARTAPAGARPETDVEPESPEPRPPHPGCDSSAVALAREHRAGRPLLRFYRANLSNEPGGYLAGRC